MFKHDIVSLPKLERIDGEIRRYRTPEGILYPSVTTVIGYSADKSGLNAWRSRVGDEEANRVSRRAARRGTEVHRLCEDLVLNREIDLRKEMPLNVQMFKQLSREIEDSLEEVNGSELFLYSDKLKVAGACDLIGTWNGKKSIIDFKTSTNFKTKENILGYFIQTALYSLMFYERTMRFHPQLVVLIAIENENLAQTFTADVREYFDQAREVCRIFHEQNS